MVRSLGGRVGVGGDVFRKFSGIRFRRALFAARRLALLEIELRSTNCGIKR